MENNLVDTKLHLLFIQCHQPVERQTTAPYCDNSLPFSGTSSIPLCHVLFPATLLHQLFFHPLPPHLAIYFLVYLSILLFPNSYIMPFWELYFLPYSAHAHTNIIYLTLCSAFNLLLISHCVQFQFASLVSIYLNFSHIHK